MLFSHCRSDGLDACELRGFLTDAVVSNALSVSRAAAKIINEQIRGRASPETIVEAALTLLRERAEEIDQLAAEINRRDVELEELEALRATRGW